VDVDNNAENLRRYRAEAVAAGLCQQCRCRPQKPGRKTCVECLARGQRNKPKLIAKRRAAGLCKCGAKPPRGYRICDACRAKDAARKKARIDRKIAEGLCRRCCREPALLGRMHCADCREKYKAANLAVYHRRKQAGLCGCGGMPARGFKSCVKCREYQRQYAAKHRRAA
jgi:hypothetical protein